MKNFKNRKLSKRNYYVVSEDNRFSEKINPSQIKDIEKMGKYGFTQTYDYYDHKVILPCKIIVEEIETNKTYFNL